jgi:hypothetical protein
MVEQYHLADAPKTTVVEARKLLGRKYKHLSDDQVQEIIVSLTLIARHALKI